MGPQRMQHVVCSRRWRAKAAQPGTGPSFCCGSAIIPTLRLIAGRKDVAFSDVCRWARRSRCRRKQRFCDPAFVSSRAHVWTSQSMLHPRAFPRMHLALDNVGRASHFQPTFPLVLPRCPTPPCARSGIRSPSHARCCTPGRRWQCTCQQCPWRIRRRPSGRRRLRW